MGKTTKIKAAKFSKKAHVESSHTTTAGKKMLCTHRKPTTTAKASQQTDSSNNKLEGPATNTLTLKIPAHVVWNKYPECTEHLLNYLDAYSDVTIKLFSDSTQAVNLERCSKLTAKSNKSATYLQVVNSIFSIDEDAAVCADFATNPNKYVKAVDNYISNM
jgi:hypothetical protein